MGSCFSSSEYCCCNNSVSSSTAKVISANGTLRHYTLPVTVSQVLLEMEMEMEASNSSCFLCNSDLLSYDDFIPPLDSAQQLQLTPIYFVLPNSHLHYRLTASDMAALAVKASTALGLPRKRIPISPVLEVKPTPGISRSLSVQKLQRYASRRAKMAIRSFRVRLSTIYEVSVAD
ncbi:hypothetical protein HHK36_031362 [Tetracentron sinense]|uniref:Uncharacterized protein n=1 Tax=Tetracentron sinense TaxID=13715 RepID=A0A834YAR4_TETSI|nr:hypothetical protein HHK36_031362 [Tetracentron sinense]